MEYASLSTEQVNETSTKLDCLSGTEIAALMNAADAQVLEAVRNAVPSIGSAIDQIAPRMQRGGRLFYIGAGTSGRLGVLDASECPPTFGVAHDRVIGIIAGGDTALRTAVEGAEDSPDLAYSDLRGHCISSLDTVVAISASGTAPYCIGGLKCAREANALAICMTCNANAPFIQYAGLSIVLATGAEVLAGSTRLKAGTATKMALNMLSTGVMVLLGKTYGNLMVDVQATNTKLRDRARRIVMHACDVPAETAEKLLETSNNDPKLAIIRHKTGSSLQEAEKALEHENGFVRKAIEYLQR